MGKAQPVTAARGDIDVDSFRSLAWEPGVPVHLRNFHHLPAAENWFTRRNLERKGLPTFSDKLQSFAGMEMPYELILSGRSVDSSSSPSSSSCLRDFQTWLTSQTAERDGPFLCQLVDRLLESAEKSHSRFLQFNAPLSLIIQAARYNSATNSLSGPIQQLYIAQCDIRGLPAALEADLPVPEIVGRTGKGDVYSSSIWLGLQPTYTPLHRDPNPNLFCQLVGSKVVRLFRPSTGLSVFRDVRRSLGLAGDARFRGPEMMDGPERDGLHHATWVDPDPSKEFWEAVLSSGDALFIPQGWWHSVRSVGHEAELNASANWWFR
ncbi:Clavaminate synthase-like protein [Nemania serpens]|nr:Clavaminate synthase-like protein [Nemania serpens]